MRNFKPVTYLLVGLNIFIFIRMFQLYGLSATDPENIYNSGGMFGNLFYQNHEWKRLITPSFVHIGITHLAFNMLALYSASSIFEQIYGSIKTLLIYLVTAVTGNVFAAFFTPAIVVAGASTSIFGMFAVLATLAVISKHDGVKNVGASYIGVILINLVYNLFTPGVSLAGHIGGAIGGLLMALILNSKFESREWISKLISLGVLIAMIAVMVSFTPFM